MGVHDGLARDGRAIAPNGDVRRTKILQLPLKSMLKCFVLGCECIPKKPQLRQWRSTLGIRCPCSIVTES